jgi:hypothetical protein
VHAEFCVAATAAKTSIRDELNLHKSQRILPEAIALLEFAGDGKSVFHRWNPSLQKVEGFYTDLLTGALGAGFAFSEEAGTYTLDLASSAKKATRARNQLGFRKLEDLMHALERFPGAGWVRGADETLEVPPGLLLALVAGLHLPLGVDTAVRPREVAEDVADMEDVAAPELSLSASLLLHDRVTWFCAAKRLLLRDGATAAAESAQCHSGLMGVISSAYTLHPNTEAGGDRDAIITGATDVVHRCLHSTFAAQAKTSTSTDFVTYQLSGASRFKVALEEAEQSLIVLEDTDADSVAKAGTATKVAGELRAALDNVVVELNLRPEGPEGLFNAYGMHSQRLGDLGAQFDPALYASTREVVDTLQRELEVAEMALYEAMTDEARIDGIRGWYVAGLEHATKSFAKTAQWATGKFIGGIDWMIEYAPDPRRLVLVDELHAGLRSLGGFLDKLSLLAMAGHVRGEYADEVARIANIDFIQKNGGKWWTAKQAYGGDLDRFLAGGCAAVAFPEDHRGAVEALCSMYNYLWVVYQSEEPVLESGAADIGAVVATIDAVTRKWDELNWKLFPRLRLHVKRGDFDYSYMKRGCHYQGCELPLRFHADGRVGHFSARAPEDAQFDGRGAVHACAAQPRNAVMACALAKHLLQSTSAGWTQERLKAWAEKRIAASRRRSGCRTRRPRCRRHWPLNGRRAWRACTRSLARLRRTATAWKAPSLRRRKGATRGNVGGLRSSGIAATRMPAASVASAKTRTTPRTMAPARSTTTTCCMARTATTTMWMMMIGLPPTNQPTSSVI